MMFVGEMLGKSLSEMRELPASELTMWGAYFKVKNERENPKENKKSDLEAFKGLVNG